MNQDMSNSERRWQEVEAFIAECNEKVKGRGAKFAGIFQRALADSLAIVRAVKEIKTPEYARDMIQIQTKNLEKAILLDCLSDLPVQTHVAEVAPQAAEIINMIVEILLKTKSHDEG